MEKENVDNGEQRNLCYFCRGAACGCQEWRFNAITRNRLRRRCGPERIGLEDLRMSSAPNVMLVHFIGLGLVVAFMASCQRAPQAPTKGPPTLQEAVAALRKHEDDITKALRANNPAAADEAMHDAMYLADHLSEFRSNIEVDKEALNSAAKRLRELLLQAHRGAHGSDDEWDPRAAADEMTESVNQLEALLERSRSWTETKQQRSIHTLSITEFHHWHWRMVIEPHFKAKAGILIVLLWHLLLRRVRLSHLHSIHPQPQSCVAL